MDIISFLFEGNILSDFYFFFGSLYYLYIFDFLFLFVLIFVFQARGLLLVGHQVNCLLNIVYPFVYSREALKYWLEALYTWAGFCWLASRYAMVSQFCRYCYLGPELSLLWRLSVDLGRLDISLTSTY